MVSSTPPIRPIQLLTLKALDPLDQKPERGEDDNRQANVEKVLHGSSKVSGAWSHPDATRWISVNLAEVGMSRVHAAPMHGAAGS